LWQLGRGSSVLCSWPSAKSSIDWEPPSHDLSCAASVEIDSQICCAKHRIHPLHGTHSLVRPKRAEVHGTARLGDSRSNRIGFAAFARRTASEKPSCECTPFGDDIRPLSNKVVQP
jgi:hypothetical protein